MKIYKKAEDDKNSSQYEWKSSQEYFTFLCSRFDINKAKNIIRAKPRKIVNMGLSGVAAYVPRKTSIENEDGTKSLVMGIRIDWEKIDAVEPVIDLSFPVIVATIGKNNYFPIDGWHRIAMAVDKGIQSLPAVILTEKETKQVRNV